MDAEGCLSRAASVRQAVSTPPPPSERTSRRACRHSSPAAAHAPCTCHVAWGEMRWDVPRASREARVSRMVARGHERSHADNQVIRSKHGVSGGSCQPNGGSWA
jgi:hypothetical protein